MQKFKDPVLLFTYFFALNGYIEYLKIDILCLLLKINMINDPSITCISGNYNSFWPKLHNFSNTVSLTGLSQFLLGVP